MASARVRRTVELPLGLAEALEDEAKRRGVSVAKVIVEACERLLEVARQ